MKYPAAFEQLVSCFHRFQGVGRKTAERLVFDLVDHWDTSAIEHFAAVLLALKQQMVQCPECRTHVAALPCCFCTADRQHDHRLCIVASSKDVYSLESTGLFQGIYHVLGGLLSPLHHRGVETMELDLLQQRIAKYAIAEVIIAVDASLEGDATVSFLSEMLSAQGVVVSRLASGVPVGVTLDFVDRGTLRRAFSGRQQL